MAQQNATPATDFSSDIYLFPLLAADEAGLVQRLAELHETVASGQPLAAIAERCVVTSKRDAALPYALALVSHNRADLEREIEKAFKGIATAFAKGREWHTPSGSYFTPQPLGGQGEIAFVYPGAFNSFVGLGHDLFQRFPDLYAWFAQRCATPDVALAENLLHSHSARDLSPAEIEQLDDQLAADSVSMMLSGTSFATIFTHLVQDYFGVKPSAAFGYSLGEGSMLWATGAWTDFDQGVAGMAHSTLFGSRLNGPKYTIRDMWHIPPEQNDESFWSTYFVLAPLEQVQEALRAEAQVYLTHINTAEEVVICGESAACRRVIEGLKCHSLRRPNSFVLHCPPALTESAEFDRVHAYPAHNVPGIRFYSAAQNSQITLDQPGLMHTLTQMACQTVDFPQLVEKVYADGARIFIELGPGTTCSRWIGKILKQRSHTTVHISQKGVKDGVSLVRLLARLVSHRVPLNLDRLNSHTQRAPLFSTQSFAKMNTNATHLADVHATFLANRQQGLGQMRDLIGLYTNMVQQATHSGAVSTIVRDAPPVQLPPIVKRPPPLFNEADIEEFAIGSVVKCFGPDFAEADQHRTPRIPNGDLKLMSRITAITGTRTDFSGISTIEAEYDVPATAWFYRQNAAPYIPYSVCMEIALQPCGFLSAYKGSFLLFPNADLYFRNLDGKASLLHNLDLRGKTITTKARLLSTSIYQGTIIQRFEFECSSDGQVFYRGSSAFGFFSHEAMITQVGLDGGKAQPSWLAQSQAPTIRLDLRDPATRARYFQATPGKPYYHLAAGQLDLLDDVVLVPDGGRFGHGYIYASRPVNPSDWFYRCHFYQDAVMPGSLGVEAMYQAMQTYAIDRGLGAHMRSPRFDLVAEQTLTWKYRGQITPDNQMLSIEIHLNQPTVVDGRVTLTGEASLWKDQLRIYEVTPIALALYDTETR